MIKFNSNPNSVIGVEIELQLIDNDTLDLNNIVSIIITDINKKFSSRIKNKLFLSMIEINSNIWNNIYEVDNDIKQWIKTKLQW